MKRTRLNTNRMLIKMRVSRLQQHITDTWQTKWEPKWEKEIMRNIYLHNGFIYM